MIGKKHPLAGEYKTIQAMIALYCRRQHGTRKGLCTQCAELSAYAGERLENCPFQENKPICDRCTVHCYKSEKRQQIREVMKYAGPRMLPRHPLSAIRHLIRGMRKHPVRHPGKPERT